jgi:group I intron endonuclease
MKRSGIYCFRNTDNGKRYIGQSVNIARRKSHHLSRLISGNHRNAHLQASFNKYGDSAFEFMVLENAPADMLDIREKSWIAYYKSADPHYGFNKTDGGLTSGSPTQETREKLSMSLTGRTLSPEHKQKLSAAAKIRRASPETREKMSNAMKGRIFSPEWKKKISDAKMGYKFSDESRQKMSKSAMGNHSRANSVSPSLTFATVPSCNFVTYDQQKMDEMHRNGQISFTS